MLRSGDPGPLLPDHGRDMEETNFASLYRTHFAELMAGRPWTVQRLEFESELVFIVKKIADVR